MGQTEIQEAAQSCPTCTALGRDGVPSFPPPVRTLGQSTRRLLDGSRMTRECHVRFCERLGVKLSGATLPTGVHHLGLNTRAIQSMLIGAN